MNRAIPRLLAVAAAALPVLLLGRPVPAAPYSGALDDLRAQLEFRRDNDFTSETLDRTQKKQQKAVLKCLAILDRPAEDLGDDCKSLIAITSAILKAYPAEFEPMLAGPVERTPFPTVLNEAQGALSEALAPYLGELDVAIGKLAPGKAKDRADAQSDKAHEYVNTGGSDLLYYVKRKLLGWNAIGKGLKAAAKGVQLPPPSFSWNVDATPFTAEVTSWQYAPSNGDLFVSADYDDPETGRAHHVRLRATGVLGTGEFAVMHNPGSVGYYYFRAEPFDFEFYDADSGGGSIDVTHLDPDTPTMSGSFSFTATGENNATQVTVTGTFTLTWNYEILMGGWD